jgi:predicted nucleotidyltransferase
MARQLLDDIARLTEQIAREFHPQRIILFGSHAAGSVTSWSDVDLLVIMPYEGSARAMAATILQRVHPAFGVDLLVRSPSEVGERLAMEDYFMREIIDHGRVLYEADHARVG